MPTELTVHAVHDGGMRVTARTDDHVLAMDYPMQMGESGTGMRPLEVLLASLAACSLNTLGLLLRRTEQPVRGMKVEARGTRRDSHPTVFTEIALDFEVRGDGVDPAAVERALATAETHMCPVWAMLKDGPRIVSTVRVVGSHAPDRAR